MAQRLEKAARLMRQSRGAFLERAGDELARQVLRAWAVDRHRRGEAAFSELARETGLAVEEIMEAAGTGFRDEALHLFQASCRVVSEVQKNPSFLSLAEEAVSPLSSERSSTGRSSVVPTAK